MRAKHYQLILSLLAFLVLAACDNVTPPTYKLSVNLITAPELVNAEVTLVEAESGEPADVFKDSALRRVFIVEPGVAYEYILEFEGELTDLSVAPWMGDCHPGEPYIQTYDDANYVQQEESCFIRIGVPEAAAEVAGVVSAVTAGAVVEGEDGVKVVLARDINGNGAYDEGVDTILSEFFIPYPEDGADGLTTLVDVTEISESEACPNGGVRIDVGLDNDGDGILNEGEITETTYICSGAPGEPGPVGPPGPTPELPQCSAELVSLSAASVELGGSYSVSWNWSGFASASISGEGFSSPREQLESETGERFEITPESAGGYSYVLTAVDANGLECTSSAYVEVVDTNAAPAAAADEYFAIYYEGGGSGFPQPGIEVQGMAVTIRVPGQQEVINRENGLLFNDSDPNGDNLYVLGVTEGPEFGEVFIEPNGSFVFIYHPELCPFLFCEGPQFAPPPAQSVTFTYEMTDGELTDTAMVTLCFVDVLPKSEAEATTGCFNEQPYANSNNYVFDPDETSLMISDPAVGLLADDLDDDGPEELTVFEVLDGYPCPSPGACGSLPEDGTVTVNEDGTFTYTPDDPATWDGDGHDLFFYTATDGLYVSFPTRVYIDQEARPVANNDSNKLTWTDTTNYVYSCTAPVNGTCNLLANDTDDDTNLSELDVVGVVSGSLEVRGYGCLRGDGTLLGTIDINLVVDAAGTYSFTIPADTFGYDDNNYCSVQLEFEYTITDSTSNSAPATVIVEITPEL